MKFLGNIIWLICGGLLTAVEYLISSLLLMVTIIGIPFGLQTLKLGTLALWPFGSRVTDNGNSGGCLCLVMNVIWIFIGGFWICLTHLFSGCCCASRLLVFLSADSISRWPHWLFRRSERISFKRKGSLYHRIALSCFHKSTNDDWHIIQLVNHSTNLICSTSTGYFRKTEAASENLVTDSVVRKRQFPCFVKRISISGWRCR